MMRVLQPSLLALCLGLSFTTCATAQSTVPPGSRTFRALASDTPQISAASASDLRIQWTTTPTPGPTAATAGTTSKVNSFALLTQRSTDGQLPRERRPELSADRLVIVVQDADGHELDWRIVMNPRIVRAEVPGPDGRLTGQVIERDDADLFVTIPRIAGARILRIYQPRRAGSEWVLDELGAVSLELR